jgi:anaerobic carbon-monoxide dehydrogenase iron sulfur subunit
VRKILARPDRCLGCRSCELACSRAHNGGSDQTGERPRPSGVTISSGLVTRDAVKRMMIYPVRCHQCDDPVCMMACLSGAITQRDDGLVVIDEEHCVGCRLCTVACPFGAITMDESRGKAVKCDLCDGRASPACVQACLVNALLLTEEGNREAR